MARSLPIEISRFQNSDEIMRDLAQSARLKSTKEAAQAYAGCAPVIVKALVERCSTEDGANRMLNSARALTWSERDTPAELFKNVNPRVGEDLAEQIFSASLPSVVTAVASSSGMLETSAGTLIEIASAVTLACLAGEPGRELAYGTFVGSVERAGQAFGVDTSLSTSGVQHADEIMATTSAAKVEVAPAAAAPAAVAAAAVAPTAGTASAPVAEAPAASDGDKKKKGGLLPLVGAGALCAAGLIGFLVLSGGSDDSTPDEVAFDATTTTAEVVTTLEDVTTTEAPVTVTEPEAEVEPVVADDDRILTLSVPMDNKTGASAESAGVLTFDFDTETGEVCYSIEATDIEGPFRSHIHVGPEGEDGGIVVDLDPRVSGDSGCVENALLDTNDILGDLDGHYAELHDVSEEWTIRGQLSEAPEAAAVQAAVAEKEAAAQSEGEILTLSVPMDNKTGASAESAGVLTFDFDTATGEVCYWIEAINIDGPFRSHIHVGPEGEDGGIVVDLDPRVSGDSGCVENALLDTNDILGDLDGHYAELHDVSEEWTIRGQLSEAPEAAAVQAAVAARVAAANAANDNTGEGSDDPAVDDLVFDVDGEGANILLKDSDLILQGEVADQATADALVASLGNVPSTTSVINNLQVVEGAPAPSGRVVIADAIFFDESSDVVKDIDAPTLAAITALAQTRADWQVTIVGHTDSKGSSTNNLELSLRRATAVRDLILAEGVPESNLRIRGSGETDPVGDNATSEGRAQNRRIEFEFAPIG